MVQQDIRVGRSFLIRIHTRHDTIRISASVLGGIAIKNLIGLSTLQEIRRIGFEVITLLYHQLTILIHTGALVNGQAIGLVVVELNNKRSPTDSSNFVFSRFLLTDNLRERRLVICICIRIHIVVPQHDIWHIIISKGIIRMVRHIHIVRCA